MDKRRLRVQQHAAGRVPFPAVPRSIPERNCPPGQCRRCVSCATSVRLRGRPARQHGRAGPQQGQKTFWATPAEQSVSVDPPVGGLADTLSVRRFAMTGCVSKPGFQDRLEGACGMTRGGGGLASAADLSSLFLCSAAPTPHWNGAARRQRFCRRARWWSSLFSSMPVAACPCALARPAGGAHPRGGCAHGAIAGARRAGPSAARPALRGAAERTAAALPVAHTVARAAQTKQPHKKPQIRKGTSYN